MQVWWRTQVVAALWKLRQRIMNLWPAGGQLELWMEEKEKARMTNLRLIKEMFSIMLKTIVSWSQIVVCAT